MLRRYAKELARSAGEEAVIIAAQKHFIAQMQGSGLTPADQMAEESEVAEVFRTAGLDAMDYV